MAAAMMSRRVMMLRKIKALGLSRQSALVLGVALGVALLSVFITETLPLMILDLREQMGLSTEQANLIRFLPATAGLLVAPSAGYIADQWGARTLLVVSLAVVCCGGFVIAISHSIGILIAGLLITGIGTMGSSVTGYTLLTTTASNSKQLGLFIAAWGITANIGYLLSPPVGSWVLVTSQYGWTSIGILWIVSFLGLLVLSCYSLDQARPAEVRQQSQVGGPAQQSPVDWPWLLNAGFIFSLTTAIPVIDVLKPGLTGLLISIDIAFIVLLCRQISRSPRVRSELQFMAIPAVLPGLLALAAICLVDWNYFSERFISLRYLFSLTQTAAWLTPANFSGLIGASAFGVMSLRFGLIRTTSTGMLLWLLTPCIFLFATVSTPVWFIAGSVALFTMMEALVFAGLQSTVTEMIPKKSLGIFGSLMIGVNTIAESAGGALTSDVMLNTYEESLRSRLEPLPLSGPLTEKVLKWLTEGKSHLLLRGEGGIPTVIFDQNIRRGSPPRLEAYVNCLHALGTLCIAMIILSGLFYAGSCLLRGRSAAQINP